MAIYNASKLKHRVKLKNFKHNPIGAYDIEEDFTDIAEVWADVRPAGQINVYNNNGGSLAEAYTIRIRHRNDIDIDSFAFWDSNGYTYHFHVNSLSQVLENALDYLVLTCVFKRRVLIV